MYWFTYPGRLFLATVVLTIAKLPSNPARTDSRSGIQLSEKHPINLTRVIPGESSKLVATGRRHTSNHSCRLEFVEFPQSVAFKTLYRLRNAKLVNLSLLTVEEASIDPLGEFGERVSKFLPAGTEQTSKGSPVTIKDYPMLDPFEDKPTITEFVRQLTRRMSEFRATLKDSAESPTGRLC